MKKVSSFVLSLGLGSALAWLVVNSTKRVPQRNPDRFQNPRRTPREDEFYGI